MLLPEAPNRESVPLTELASLDPCGTVGLFGIDPASPHYGRRVPFDLIDKEEAQADGAEAHVLVIVPTHPLEPR